MGPQSGAGSFYLYLRTLLLSLYVFYSDHGLDFVIFVFLNKPFNIFKFGAPLLPNNYGCIYFHVNYVKNQIQRRP